MTKKSLANFIKGVLGEILFKKQKNDLFINQKIVANSISKNKRMNLPEEKNFGNIDTKNELEVTDSFLNKVKLKNARIYLTGTNLLTISRFKIWDVEMGGNGLGYPIQQTTNIGINLNF